MGITGGGGFHDDIGVGAQPFFGQGMVHRAGSHQGVDGQLVLDNTVIGKHQDHLAIADRLGSLFAHGR